VFEREFNGRTFLLAALLFAATSPSLAQDSGNDFAKKPNNPVASLVSVPSCGGEREYPNANDTFLQPLLSYTGPDTTNLGLNTESTYNWTTGQWTVPINLTAGHLSSLGGPYYPEHPHDAASWGLRFAMTFLFPK
jgi:hypothetical protein